MLPLITPRAPELGGIVDESAGNLPGSGESVSDFAGILNQSTSANGPEPTGPGTGQDLPADGKLLPSQLPADEFSGLEAELSVAQFLGLESGDLRLAEVDAPMFDLERAARFLADAANGGLGELTAGHPDVGLQPMPELADLLWTQPVGLAPEQMAVVSQSGRLTGASIGLVTEQQLGDRRGLVVADLPLLTTPKTTLQPQLNGEMQLQGLSSQLGRQAALAGEPAISVTSAIQDELDISFDSTRSSREILEAAATRLTNTITGSSASTLNGATAASVSINGQTQPSAPVTGTVSTATLQINTPLTDPAWGNALGNRVLLMSGQQLQTAELRISPAELGPITVNLSVEDGSADLTFFAQQALTRDAIEQALPRLRDMLTENGLSLGNATVSEQGVQKEGADRGAQAPDQGSAAAEGSQTVNAAPDLIAERVARGLIDTFV